MTLEGCTTLCPLNKFVNLTKNAVIETFQDWERECLMGWDNINSRDVIGNYLYRKLIILHVSTLILLHSRPTYRICNIHGSLSLLHSHLWTRNLITKQESYV